MVRLLQQSMVDIANYVRDHPQDAKPALAKGYPQLGPADIDLAFS
jgi:cytochrome c